MPSDTNRVALRIRKETSYGVLPGSPVFQNLRYTSESFKQDTESTQSQEIRSDRAVSDIIRTGVAASGEIGFEMSYGSYDEIMSAVLGDTDTAFSAIHTISASTGISADNATNSFTSSGLFTVANGFTAGAWIKVSGFTTTGAANNRIWKIRTRTSDNNIVVEGGVVATKTSGDPVTIVRGGSIRTGTTLATFTVEKEFTDQSNNFEYIRGVAFDRMSMEISPDGIMTGSFTTLGRRGESGTATLSSGGTPTAATTTPVLNGIDNVLLIMEGFEGTHAAPNLTITGFNFEIGNNLRTRQEVGTLGATSLGTGTHDVTGTVMFYYPDANNTLLDKYLNWTASSFAIAVGESATSNNVYVFDFPQVRFTDGSRNATGINDDVMVDLAFQAYLDPTLGYTMQIVKFT